MSQAITSIDVNYAPSGGQHTASVAAIKNVLPVADGELGYVSGEVGESSDFSTDAINELLKNFVLEKQTLVSNGRSDTIKREYIHSTSLQLETNLILVRGLNAPPIGESAEYEGPVLPFSELPETTLRRFKITDSKVKEAINTAKGYKQIGVGVHVIGQTYSVISDTLQDYTKVMLVYQNGELKEDLCLNADEVSDDYKTNPDPAAATLKYGFTLSDLKKALNNLAITTQGLPEYDNWIFDVSGTLKDVLSHVAAALGYYWYIDPNTEGRVFFVSSETATAIEVEDVTQTNNVLQASFTEGLVPSRLVTTYSASTKPENGYNTQIDSRPRKKPFYALPVLNLLPPAVVEAISPFMTLFFAENIGGDSFDKMFFTSLMNENYYNKIKDIEDNVKTDPVLYQLTEEELVREAFTFAEIIVAEAARPPELKSEVYGDRTDSRFHRLVGGTGFGLEALKRPSEFPIYTLAKGAIELGGNLFISNLYSEGVAERMSFQAKQYNVAGPYKGDVKLKDVPELQQFVEFLGVLSKQEVKEKTLADLYDLAEIEAEGAEPVLNPLEAYMFVAVNNLKFGSEILNEIDEKEKREILDFSLLSTEVELPFNFNSIDHIGYKTNKTFTDLAAKLTKSTELFKKAWQEKEDEPMIRLLFQREKLNDEERESADGGEAIDFDFLSMKVGNLEGSHNTRLSHKTVTGTYQEIEKLEGFFSETAESAEQKEKTNSETFVGVQIPDNIDISIGSISLTVGSEGVQTTITRGNYNFLPPDQTLILGQLQQAAASQNFRSLLSTSRKNALGV